MSISSLPAHAHTSLQSARDFASRARTRSRAVASSARTASVKAARQAREGAVTSRQATSRAVSASASAARTPVPVPAWALVGAGAAVVAVAAVGVYAYRRRRTHASDTAAMYTSASEILRAASHETSTPLAVIDGYCELLLDSTLGPLTLPQADAVRAVAASTHRLRLVASSVLLLAGVDAGASRMYAEDLDAAALAVAATRDYRVAYPDHEVVVSAQVPRVWADPTALRLIMDNLVSNAVKASEPGSRVDVSFAPAPSGWSLVVTDTGHGIPAEEVTLVFDRYARSSISVDNNVPGTGIGLAVVAALASAHSAGVTVSSVVGEGTTFTLDFPSAAPHPLPPAAF